jgi:hypothetical protein
MIPQNYVKLEGKVAQQMLKLMEALDDQDDVPARLVELRHLGEGDRGLARVRVFGIDPGSGCAPATAASNRRVAPPSGWPAAPSAPRPTRPSLKSSSSFTASLTDPAARMPARIDSVAIENLFFRHDVRSALKLGHARGRGDAGLPSRPGVPVVEYTTGLK